MKIIKYLVIFFCLGGLLGTLKSGLTQGITPNVPKTANEPFIHIYSEKDGRTNAVIICQKQDDLCLEDTGKAITRNAYIQGRGYKNVMEYKIMTFSDKPYFVMFVSK